MSSEQPNPTVPMESAGSPESPAAHQQGGAVSDPGAVTGGTGSDGPEPKGPSRLTAWLGMGAVAVTLGLLWMVPTLDDHSGEVSFADAYGNGDEGAAIGAPARLDFTMKDMNGVDVKLSSFKGKVILLNFWATWCGPCKVEIPDLVSLQNQYRDELVVLGVLVQDEMNGTIPAFAAEYQINYPLLDGNNREDVETAYGPFWGIPSSVIVGPDGRIAQKHSGIRSREQFEREIAALVPEDDGTSE